MKTNLRLKNINKLIGIGMFSIATFTITSAMSGCMGTKYLSEGITAEGTVVPENVVFPDIDKAWKKEGLFPNSENLSKVKSGISKDELYQLIGRPHFSEAQHAYEWDYIMKFYQPDDTVKTCQYKVIFDKDFKGQQFYWKPENCIPKGNTTSQPIVTVPIMAAPVKERVTLSADALFEFDKWRFENMLSQGKNELDKLAIKLKEYQHSGNMRIVITGHTDRLGDDIYNLNLSQLRAQTVRRYLMDKGVEPSSLIANGAGESQPIKQCLNSLSKQQLIHCLQPNRRVTLDILVNE